MSMAKANWRVSGCPHGIEISSIHPRYGESLNDNRGNSSNNNQSTTVLLEFYRRTLLGKRILNNKIQNYLPTLKCFPSSESLPNNCSDNVQYLPTLKYYPSFKSLPNNCSDNVRYLSTLKCFPSFNSLSNNCSDNVQCQTRKWQW